MTPLRSLDREAVKIVYFRADTEDTITGMDVSWDDGATWEALEAATDGDALDAYQMTVRGPLADSTTGKLLALGYNRGVVRIQDTPEVEIHRFRIEVR